MADLSVDFCGVRFPNPITLAAGFPVGVGSGPFLRRVAESGAGGVAARSTFLEVVAVSQLVRPKYSVSGNTLIHFDGVFEAADVFYGKQAELAKVNGVPLIASILARSMDEYREQVRMADASPFIDVIEVNVSCPGLGHFGMKMKHARSNISQEPELVREILRECRPLTKKPMVAKLSALADDIVATAKAAVAGGADAIAAINTLPNGMPPIDIETGKPAMPVLGVCGGEMLKPLALAAVALITKSVDVPVMGIGGAFGWRDAVEMLMCGATLVGVSSAAVLRGPGIFSEIADGLGKYLDSHGYRSPADIRGITRQYIFPPDALPPSDLVSVIDPETCTRCEKCLDICAYLAIEMEPNPVVDRVRCAGCGLCTYICPAHAATMKSAKEA